MTDETKKETCKCCLGLGVVVLVAGIVFGVINENGLGLVHIAAIVVGFVMILAGLKKTKMCKCCNK